MQGGPRPPLSVAPSGGGSGGDEADGAISALAQRETQRMLALAHVVVLVLDAGRWARADAVRPRHY
jgi:hypothetical protein